MTKAIGGLAIVALISFCVAVMSCSYSGAPGVATAAPGAPKDVRVAVVPQGVEISWDKVTAADRYTVFWGTEKGEYRSLVNTRGSSLVLTGLTCGELYTFSVTAWNAKGESGYSKERIVVYDNRKDQASAHLARANELMLKGAYGEADAYFSTAIRLGPENAEAYRDRAQLYAKTDRAALASEDIASAEKIYKKKTISFVPRRQSESN